MTKSKYGLGHCTIREGYDSVITGLLSTLADPRDLAKHIVSLNDSIKIDDYLLYELIDNNMFRKIAEYPKLKEKIAYKDDSIIKGAKGSAIDRIYMLKRYGIESILNLKWDTRYNASRDELNRIDFNLIKDNRIRRNDYVVFNGENLRGPNQFYTAAEAWLLGFGFEMIYSDMIELMRRIRKV